MMKLNRVFTLLLLLVAFSCKKTSSPAPPNGPDPGKPSPVTGIPVVKPAGNALGNPFVRQIGPEGGTIVSEDHVISIEIPAGVVSSLTTFSVTPVENNLDTIHTAYRFQPEGIAFAKPVKIVYHYANDSLYGNNPRMFNLLYRDGDGHFWRPKGMVHDAQAQTYSIQTIHFSDWSISENYEIQFNLDRTVDHRKPPHIGASEQVNLFVTPTYGTNDDTTELFITPLTESDAQQTAQWKIVSGPGTLKVNPGSHSRVTYTAPDNILTPATVTISCTMNGDFGKDNFGNPVKQMIVLQTIYLDAKYFSVVVDGGDAIQLHNLSVVDIGTALVAAGADMNGVVYAVQINGKYASTYAFDMPGTPGAAYLEMTTETGNSFRTYYPKDCTGEDARALFSSGSVTLSQAGSKEGDYVTGKIEGATVYVSGWCDATGIKKHTLSGKFTIQRSDN